MALICRPSGTSKQRTARQRKLPTIIIVNAAMSGAGLLRGFGKVWCCALGRSGIGLPKREGDGKTPGGRLAVLYGFWRSDRLPRPATRLPIQAIGLHDGWCDTPDDRRYNRRVRLPHPASAEAMMRADGVYDIVLVLEWNVRPRARNRGSAIFLHCARPDYAPTEGCIALARNDLLRLLQKLRAGDEIRIIREGGAG